VADQNARITSLERNEAHSSDNFTGIYDRLRKLERLETIIETLTGKPFLVLLCILLLLIIAGGICDAVYHMPIMIKIFTAVKP